MKFLTALLRSLKFKRNLPGGKTAFSEEPSGNEEPRLSGKEGEAPSSGTPARKKYKTIVAAAVVLIFVALAIPLGTFLFWGPAQPAHRTAMLEPPAAAPLSEADTALFRAVRSGDSDEARRALNEGARAHAVDSFGSTPMRAAIALNRVEIVHEFLEAGQGDSPEGSSSLLYAIVQNKPGIVRALLTSAEPDKADRNGRTPLMYAVSRNYMEITRVLLESGADVNRPDENGYTPLMTAVMTGKADMVWTLMEAGADVNAASSSGETAMDMARRRNRQVQLIVSLLQGSEK